MCCGKPNIKEKDEKWFENIRAGGRVVTFAGEAEAQDFLAKGIDNVPEDMAQIYTALRFRWELANY